MPRTSPLKHLHPDATTYEDVGDAETAAWFEDATAEYHALRGTFALFDHSSVGLISVEGDVEDFLGDMLARDVQYLTSEQCTTSLVLDDEGIPVDIVTLYGLEDGALIETSFGRGTATLEHLQARAGDSVEVRPLWGEQTVVGIEGPYAWGLVGRLIDQEFTALPYESTLETQWNGHDILFARCGFTGEYGYKVIASHEAAATFWETARQDAAAAGQVALETAMLEVRQPLLHRELGSGDDILTCGWNWLVDLSKDEYLGREALDRAIAAGAAAETVGFRLAAASAPAAGAAVYAGDVPVGRVVHSVWSPAIDEWVGLARIEPTLTAAGLDLAIDGGDEWCAIRTASSPYVIPASWSVPVF
jgi:glycine cleavage system aminomethyltransferase T